jgi:hypothetical protein
MQLRRLLATLVAFAALIGPVVLHAAPASAASPGEFIGQINGLRASKGVGGLSVDGNLSGQAQNWAQQMANSGGISHNPSLGSTPGGWVKIGENVGAGGSAGSIFNALVASPGHYRNMVDGSFNRIGVGVAMGSDGRVYTCHVFANVPGGGGGGGGYAAPAPSAGGGGGAAAPASSGGGGGYSSGGSGSSGSGSASGGSSGGGGAAAPAAEQAPPPPPPPEPDARIVASLDEVGSILTQG